MRDLADKYFFDVYLNAEKLNERNQPKPNSFDDTMIRNGHLNVELENVERDFNRIYPKGAPIYLSMCLIIQTIKYGESMRRNYVEEKLRKEMQNVSDSFKIWDVVILN